MDRAKKGGEVYRDSRQIEATFSGAVYKVEFYAYDASYRTTTRDSMGDDVEDLVTQWKGEVVVRDLATNECVAACKLGIYRDYGYEAVRQRIFLDALVPGMETAYADFLAKKILAAFQKGEGRGIPVFTLIYRLNDWEMERKYNEANRRELLEAGLILDEHGQRTLALK